MQEHLESMHPSNFLGAIAMNIIPSFRAFFVICAFSCHFPLTAQQACSPSISWNVYFSPQGGATSAIVQTLNKSKSTVLVQAYSFTSKPIAEALVRAHERGVRVEVLLDRSQKTQRFAVIDLLIHSAIPTRIDAAHAIAHSKVMIIDNEIVIAGSFNLTKASEERNSENLLIIRDRRLAFLYADKWNLHRKHCVSLSSGPFSGDDEN